MYTGYTFVLLCFTLLLIATTSANQMSFRIPRHLKSPRRSATSRRHISTQNDVADDDISNVISEVLGSNEVTENDVFDIADVISDEELVARDGNLVARDRTLVARDENPVARDEKVVANGDEDMEEDDLDDRRDGSDGIGDVPRITLQVKDSAASNQ